MKIFRNIITCITIGATVALCSCGPHSQKRSDDASAGSASRVYAGKLHFKIFLESSGSMFPYDSPRGDGSFKSAVSTLINEIPASATSGNELYVVNSQVTRYEGSYKDFLVSKSIFDQARSIGDFSYTDFTAIFDTILNHTGKGEVGILVSDLIYSTPSMSDTNPKKILSEARSLVTSVFSHEGSRKDVAVVKMTGDYHGPYYSYNSPRNGKAYSGERPYYFMIVAGEPEMRRIFTSREFADFSDFSKLHGYEGYYCFAAKEQTPYWSFMLSGPGRKGKYSKDNNGKAVHDLKKVEASPSGQLGLLMAVDMGGVLAPEQYKTDPANYQVDSQCGLEVESVTEIDRDALSKVQEKYVGTATHYILLTTDDKPKNGKVRVSLKNRLPRWVKQTGTSDDTDVSAPGFASTTFGFEEIMEGLRDAYYGTDNEPYYFRLSFEMRR